MIHNNWSKRSLSAKSFKFLPYQLDGSVLDYHGING